MIKTKLLIYGFALLLFANIMGCDDYQRTEVEDNIFVNMSSLTPFVGDEIQLVASPTDGTYNYTWSSENSEVATVNNSGLVNVLSEGFTTIIVRGGNLETKIPLTASVRIPLTDVVLSETSVTLFLRQGATILTTNVPDNANDIGDYTWYSEDPNIATVNEVGKITAVNEGETNIVYKVGDIVKKVSVLSATTFPFKGPHILSAEAPYKLMAADFDFGGEGNAFHDADAANKTNNNYRRDNGDPQGSAVDIEGNGANLGYTNAGEWLVYTLEVVDEGDYLVEISLSANSNDAKFHLEIDNVPVTDVIDIPNNNSWGDYRWIPPTPLTVHFKKGKQKFKYYFDGGGHNLAAYKFTKK